MCRSRYRAVSNMGGSALYLVVGAAGRRPDGCWSHHLQARRVDSARPLFLNVDRPLGCRSASQWFLVNQSF